MDPARIAALLDPFLDRPLPPATLEQISTYIDLLRRWNARINLTAVRDPEQIVTRHFGESFFLARHLLPDSAQATPHAPLNGMERTFSSAGVGRTLLSAPVSQHPQVSESVSQPHSDQQAAAADRPRAAKRRHAGVPGTPGSGALGCNEAPEGRKTSRDAKPEMPEGPQPSSFPAEGRRRVPQPSAFFAEAGEARALDRGPQHARFWRAGVVDLGSGAGFPGLPLKLWAPALHLTLVESNHKKAAFLREVARALTLTDVDVSTDRAETLAARVGDTFPAADLVTLRAVERFETILPLVTRFLAPAGRLALLIGSSQIPSLSALAPQLSWLPPVPIPQSQSRVLSIGILSGSGIDP